MNKDFTVVFSTDYIYRLRGVFWGFFLFPASFPDSGNRWVSSDCFLTNRRRNMLGSLGLADFVV